MSETAMWKAIKANRTDNTLKLALADWYAENGRAELEHALRWCVHRGKWPYVSERFRAVWWGRKKNRDASFNLPRAVFYELPGKARIVNICRTEKSAIEKLAIALAYLKALAATGAPT
jgi:uncharacterized protein (TIGR02996 family)